MQSMEIPDFEIPGFGKENEINMLASPEVDTEIHERFEKELRMHGHGFQYAVLKKIKELFPEKSAFQPFVSEFPIEINKKDSRIDFILLRKPNFNAGYNPFLLIAECKQVNPAFSQWCFVKSSIDDNSDSKLVNLETIHTAGEDEQGLLNFTSNIYKLHYSPQEFFDIAFTMKSNAKGNNSAAGRDSIEEAITQVLRGLNGLVEFTMERPTWLKSIIKYGIDLSHNSKSFDQASLTFLPVIFTTAELYVSTVDLSTSDLITGDLELAQESLTKKDWLFFQYNQSQSLKHSKYSNKESDWLPDILDTEFKRSVAIVSSSGIEKFLAWVSTARINE